MQTAATPKRFPSHLAVIFGHVANGVEILRTWEASGKEVVRKQQQPQNGSPRSLLLILGMSQIVFVL